jgi:hypothetical protein
VVLFTYGATTHKLFDIFKVIENIQIHMSWCVFFLRFKILHKCEKSIWKKKIDHFSFGEKNH